MEKLTIKELAPYLPYGLKVVGVNIYINKGMVCDLTDRNLWTHIENQSKPLLRPLSSLTEERRSGKYNTDITEIVNECEQHCDAYNEWLEIFIDDPDPSRILQAPYEVAQELLARKYDVFNLIPRGLALPIEGKEVEGE